MIRELDDLDKFSIGRFARKDQPMTSKLIFVTWVELIAMTVAFADFGCAVNLISKRSFFEIARIRSKPHRSAQSIDPNQIAKLENHGMNRVVVKFGRVCAFEPALISREFDRRALHSKTDAKIWSLFSSRVV